MKRLEVLDTPAFWDKMCSPGFVRISPNWGVIGNTWYFTRTPPESVPGYLDTVVDHIAECLAPTRQESLVQKIFRALFYK